MAEGTVTLPVVSQSRAPAGQVEVPAAVVAGPVREHLLHAAVRSQLAARRAGTVATKTKGLVSGGGKKPWRQKGTGRARAGSIRSPLWAGGGTTFGPQPRDWAYRLPRTARKAALRAALASRHAAGTLLVVDGLSLPEPKTKRMVECLRGLGLEGASVLIVLARADEPPAREGPPRRPASGAAPRLEEGLHHAGRGQPDRLLRGSVGDADRPVPPDLARTPLPDRLRLRRDHQGPAGAVADRAARQVRGAEQPRAHDHPPSRRRPQAPLSGDRLQARQDGRAGKGGRHRVRSEPLGAYRAPALRRR